MTDLKKEIVKDLYSLFDRVDILLKSSIEESKHKKITYSKICFGSINNEETIIVFKMMRNMDLFIKEYDIRSYTYEMDFHKNIIITLDLN